MVFRAFITYLLCSLLFGAPAFAGSISIAFREHPVRSTCGFFAPVEQKAVFGEIMTVTGKEGAWLKVQYGELKGCIHSSAASADRDGSDHISPLFSALTEMLLWKVLSELKFDTVDRIEEYQVPDYTIRDFMKSGGLVLLQ